MHYTEARWSGKWPNFTPKEIACKCCGEIVVDEAKNKELRAMANEVFNRRDDRLRSMTDESVPVFYTCIMCQAFSPASHPRL